ncbi:MAG: hypothetical protein WCW27_04725 [Patescibacteria group bacterium]|jgi:hypothetical protein
MIIMVTNCIWIYQDQSPPLSDMAGHSFRSVQMAHWLQDGKLLSILKQDTIYPPFTYLVTGIIFLLVGYYPDIPQYSLLLWVIILMISIYSIGNTIYKNKYLALGATALTMCYPLVAHFSRIYDLDFPLTALVTASMAVLLQTNHFAKRRETIVFSLLVVAVLLTKWTGVFFIVGPAFIVLLSKRNNINIKNISLALGIILVLTMPWYWLHTNIILDIAEATRNNVFSVPHENLLRLKSLLFYARSITQGIIWPLTLIFLTGVIICFKKIKRCYFWLLVSWLIIPYLIFTFIYSKEIRYLMPLYPALALCSMSCFSYLFSAYSLKLKRRWVFSVIISVFSVILMFCIWFDTSWGTRLLPFSHAYGYQKITPKQVYYGFTYPTQYHTTLMLVAQELANIGSAKVAVVPNSIFLTATQIQYYTALHGNIKLNFSLSSKLRNPAWRDVLPQADYVITKTGEQGPKLWAANLKDIATAEQNNDVIFQQFELIGQWQLNGIETSAQQINLYKKNDKLLPFPLIGERVGDRGRI